MKILRLVPIVFVSGAALVALPALALQAPISLPAPGSGTPGSGTPGSGVPGHDRRDDGAQPGAPPCDDDDDDDAGDDDDDGEDDDGGELPALT